MRRFGGLLAVGLLLTVILWNVPALAAPKDNRNFAQDHILVKFKDGTSESTKQALQNKFHDSAEEDIDQLGVRIINVPAGKVNERLAEYSSDRSVQYAEPDFTVKADIVPELIPDDPSFSSQWGLTKIQAPAAWDISTGSASVDIAILDSGIDLDHEDLAAKIVVSHDFTKSKTRDDLFGHGTHVAGIAAVECNSIFL